MLCFCVSCGLEKTAHNILLYKLNCQACQQFITRAVKYFRQSDQLLASIGVRSQTCVTIKFAVDDRYCDRKSGVMKG
jgi:hypothetical protein